MKLDIHLHIQRADEDEILQVLKQLLNRSEKIMASQQEAAGKLGVVGQKLDKISAETTSLVEEVRKLKEAAEAAGEVTPELQAAIDAVSSKADEIDAHVDDIAPNPTPTPEEPPV